MVLQFLVPQNTGSLAYPATKWLGSASTVEEGGVWDIRLGLGEASLK